MAKVMQFERSDLVAEMEILRERLSEERASASDEDPVSTALAGRIAGLEEQLAEQQARLYILETAEPGDLFILSPIGEPTITSTTSGSRSKTTIAVAGFLGLMLGVLLAFFVHYLVQVNARERRTAKAAQQRINREIGDRLLYCVTGWRKAACPHSCPFFGCPSWSDLDEALTVVHICCTPAHANPMYASRAVRIAYELQLRGVLTASRAEAGAPTVLCAQATRAGTFP